VKKVKRGKITSYLIIAIMVTIMIMMLLGLGTIFYPAIGLRDTHAAQTASATDEKAAEVINGRDPQHLVPTEQKHQKRPSSSLYL
jgi:flagellar basal body-associated protein FliL